MLRAGLEEIEAVDPQPGEDARAARRGRAARRTPTACGPAPRRPTPCSPATTTSSVPARRECPSRWPRRAPRSAGWPSTTRPCSSSPAAWQELGYLAADLGGDLAAYLAGVEVDPARLAWVQQRRAELARLQRKYGDTIDEVLAWAKESAARLDELEGADDRAAELEAQAGDAARRARRVGGERSARRARTAAVTFGKRVTTELAHLAMGKAVVQAALGRRPDPEGLRAAGRDGARAVHPARRRRGRDPARRRSRRPGTQRRQGGVRR